MISFWVHKSFFCLYFFLLSSFFPSLPVPAPLLLFTSKRREHCSQNSLQAFLIESNGSESLLYIKWNTLHESPGMKWLAQQEAGGLWLSLQVVERIKYNFAKITLKEWYFLSKHVPLWNISADIHRDRNQIVFLTVEDSDFIKPDCLFSCPNCILHCPLVWTLMEYNINFGQWGLSWCQPC